MPSRWNFWSFGNSNCSTAGNAAASPRNEPNVPMYSSDITHACGSRTAASCSRSVDRDTCRLSMNSHAHAAAATASGSQNSGATTSGACAKTSSGTTNCIVDSPMFPPAAFSPSAVPLSRSG